MNVSRNSYSTGVISLYQAGLLPDDLLRDVPYSTRHNWKKRDLNLLFGADDPRLSTANMETVQELISQNHLLPVVKVLLRINRVLKNSLKNMKGYKKVLSHSSEQIIRTIERFHKHLGKKRILQWIGVSAQQFHYWKRNVRYCPSSILNLCRIRHPHQLSVNETGIIKKYLNNPTFNCWSLSSIYYAILRDRKAFFSLSTFYHYARQFGISRNYRSFKKHGEGIRATRPGEIIHVDITEFRLATNIKAHIYHVVDNFSRFVFTCRAEFNKSASTTLENIRNILREHSHLFHERFTVLVDDGSENKGEVIDFHSDNRELFQLMVAGKDIQFSNSMVEAANKTLKIQYIKDKEFLDLESLQSFLDNSYRKDFNNRPLHSLHGLTPIEVLNGQTPQKSMFSVQILEARILRIRENMNYNCDSCSSTDLTR